MQAKAASPTGQTILDAAYRCMVRNGYAAVSMRQIAREAGVALSQLHYYFRSKDHLLVEVLRRTMEQHVRETVSRLAELPPERRVHGLLALIRTKLRQDPGWFRLLFDSLVLASRDPEARQQVRRLFQELSEEAGRRFPQLWQMSATGRAGTVRGRLQPWPGALSPTALGRVVVATLYGLALQLLVEGADQASEPLWFGELMAAVSPAGQ
ncbi:MAG: TetR/AcrR family transcriptional regulator [Firmicutes bacterium]|nr:TetR/AcrR family transcriptional regulator [Bacillota bacterium]